MGNRIMKAILGKIIQYIQQDTGKYMWKGRKKIVQETNMEVGIERNGKKHRKWEIRVTALVWCEERKENNNWRKKNMVEKMEAKQKGRNERIKENSRMGEEKMKYDRGEGMRE